MRTPRVFKYLPIYELFQEICPDYNNETILDFGGNHGNLIKSSFGEISPENYTSMDINVEPLSRLPEGCKSIYWNRYHPTYNETGENINFPILNTYDMAFANSVFTHMSIEEILYCLYNLCMHTSTVYFTYVDPTNKKFWQRLKSFDPPIKLTDQQIESLADHDLSYVINHEHIILEYPSEWPSEWQNMWTLTKTDWLIDTIKRTSPFIVNIETGETSSFNYMKVQVNEDCGNGP